MKNKIAVNAKYYKASQVEGVSGHVFRLFAEDKNVHDSELTKNNFGSNPAQSKARYESALESVKGLKKNSNTLVDAVFVFPLEQWEIAREKGMTNDEVDKFIRKTMVDIENECGLQPIGYQMHLDEGHEDSESNFILNPHCHMQFVNVCRTDVTLELERNVTVKDANGKAIKDKKTTKWLYQRDEEGGLIKEQYKVSLKDKMPLQYLRGRGSNSVWSRMQDLAANNFSEFGFDRGESAELTKRKHKKKKYYVEQLLKQELARSKQLKTQNSELQRSVEFLMNKSNKIKQDLKSFCNRLKEFTDELVAKRYSSDLAVYKEDVLDSYTVIDKDACDTAHAITDAFVNKAIDVETASSLNQLKSEMKEIDKQKLKR